MSISVHNFNRITKEEYDNLLHLIESQFDVSMQGYKQARQMFEYRTKNNVYALKAKIDSVIAQTVSLIKKIDIDKGSEKYRERFKELLCFTINSLKELKIKKILSYDYTDYFDLKGN